MTDRTALILAALTLAILALDAGLLDGAGTLFLLRKLARLVDFLTFWD